MRVLREKDEVGAKDVESISEMDGRKELDGEWEMGRKSREMSNGKTNEEGRKQKQGEGLL